MDHLRQGIHLVAMQKNQTRIQRESFELFEGLLDSLKSDVVTLLSKVRVQQQEEVERMEAQRQAQAEAAAKKAQAQHPSSTDEDPTGDHQPLVREERKVGRNEHVLVEVVKYKQCHGQIS